MAIERWVRLRCDFARCKATFEHRGPGYVARNAAARANWDVRRNEQRFDLTATSTSRQASTARPRRAWKTRTHQSAG